MGTLLYSISAFISIKNMLHYFIEKEETTPQSRVFFQSLHLAVSYTRSDSEFQFHETNTHLLYIFIQMRPLITIEIVHRLKFRRKYCVQRGIILRTSDPRKDHAAIGHWELCLLYCAATLCAPLSSPLRPSFSLSLSLSLSLLYISLTYI